MRIDVLTLFPEMFSALESGIMGKALSNGLIELNKINIRDFSKDRHKKCDDYAFGGGAGMVMLAQPICDTFRTIDPNHKGLHIYLSPKGKQLNQEMVIELAKNPYLILLCGHYEGVDQRAIDKNIDIEISIGDYVLMGGELPAMVLIEAVSRYIPKVLHSEESTAEETFIDNLLEYPQYTRPFDFEGDTAPDVLISGNHENIKKWRYNERVKLTEKLRPDLLKKNNKI